MPKGKKGKGKGKSGKKGKKAPKAEEHGHESSAAEGGPISAESSPALNDEVIQLKAAGNKDVGQGDFAAAVRNYTSAIELLHTHLKSSKSEEWKTWKSEDKQTLARLHCNRALYVDVFMFSLGVVQH